MGEVWRARDPRLGRDVAVKVIRRALLADDGAAARFDLEARAAAAISHPNVRAVFDVGEADGQTYVVCELLDGITLRERIAGGTRLTAREAVHVARQIADGLAAAHASGVIHRDLKPENVFLTRDGPVKILDFGLAKLRDPEAAGADSTLTGEGAVLGTVAYMAPEQLRGQAADARADLFALGVVLHELLAGRRPFGGESSADLMAATLREAPEPLPAAVPPVLARLVERCLEKDRSRRFQSARDLGFALEQTALAPPRSPAPAPRRRWWYGLALAPIAAAAGAAWMAKPAPEPPRFQRLSFRRGDVWSARFAPDGAVYYEHTLQGRKDTGVFRVRPSDPESRSLGIAGAGLFAVSPTGELAVRLNPGTRGHAMMGVLARVSPEGGTPRELATRVTNADWSPDGSQLAVSRNVEGTDLVELPVGKVIYRTQGGIDDLRFSPDGTRLAFTENRLEIGKRAHLVILDRDGNVLRRSREYHDLYGLAWSPRGELWFTACDEGMNRSLRALTDGGDRNLLRIPARLTLLDVAPDGRVLLLTVSWRASAMWRDAGADSVERDLSWLDRSVVADLSRDGTRLLLQEIGEGGGARHRTYLRETTGADAVWLGDGAGIAIAPGGGEVLIAKLDRPAELEVVPTGPGVARAVPPGDLEARQHVVWLPDGRIAYTGVARDLTRRIYVQELEGAPRPLSPPGWLIHAPRAAAPDGKVVVARRWGFGKLHLWPIDGGEPVEVAGVERGETFAGWRGNRLLVFAEKKRVHAVDPATGARELVRELAAGDDDLVNVADLRLLDSGAYAYTRIIHSSDLYVVSGIE
jgi:tRNA A-37 threonylcarbamoyl transferase component Bud32